LLACPEAGGLAWTAPLGSETPPARTQPLLPQLVPVGQQNEPQQIGLAAVQ